MSLCQRRSLIVRILPASKQQMQIINWPDFDFFINDQKYFYLNHLGINHYYEFKLYIFCFQNKVLNFAVS